MGAFNFTDIEKQAIVSLIIEMINADRVITLEEMLASNAINAELSITEDVFRAGMAMDFEYACRLVGKMDLQPKCHVAQLLTRIMDSDGANEAELQLLNRIGRLTGLTDQLECESSE